MNSEIFIKKLREVILNDYITTYKEIYESTQIDENIKKDQYWLNALVFYQSLPSKEKEILFKIIQQTIIDTTSTILGIIDGPVSLEGIRGEFQLAYQPPQGDEVILSGDLQDDFLSTTNIT
ncbi:transposase [Acinetobacter pittii]|uniref:transposase n=1 Tax=Acinetobacter pittii TaxID=48296 RepID=UPI00281312A2|nr:transposase [Acinetobacter pittii]MDQ9888494.1 transposase [Acinetobacter pittii]